MASRKKQPYTLYAKDFPECAGKSTQTVCKATAVDHGYCRRDYTHLILNRWVLQTAVDSRVGHIKLEHGIGHRNTVAGRQEAAELVVDHER